MLSDGDPAARSGHRRVRPGAFAAALLVVAIGIGACGGSSGPHVVGFDARRALASSSQRALDSVAGVTSTVPTGLTDADLMSGVVTPFVGFTDAATRRTYNAQIAQARGAARRYANAAAAAADGYVITSYFIADFGTHWINWDQVKRPFDPARPAMLLYDGDGTGAHLVGLSYYQFSPNGEPPAGFAGANDRWHRHFGTCYSGGFLVGENVATRDTCRKICQARATNAIHAAVGTTAEIPEVARYLEAHSKPAPDLAYCRLVPGDDLWMLHLWVVPGHSNPTGLFSTLNPRVAVCAGQCRKL